MRTALTDLDLRSTSPDTARPPVPNLALDRRTLLRAAGLTTVLTALGACGGSEPEPPSDVDVDSEDGTVRDGFDRPDGPIGRADSGQIWVEAGGTWSILSGAARAVTEFRSQVCAAMLETDSPDGRLELSLRLSSTRRRANAGAVLRVVDADNGLFVKLERTPVNPDGMLAIGMTRDGRVEYPAIRTSGIAFGNGDALRLVVDLAGPLITVSVSTGETIEHALDDEDAAIFAGQTQHGLRINIAPDDDDGGSSFDQLRFTPSS